MELLTTKFKNKIKGILSCYDRVIIKGTIPGICYAEGMTAYLYAMKIRIFDFYKFAKLWRNQIILNSEKIAVMNGLKIEYIRKKNFRKEAKIKEIHKKLDKYAKKLCPIIKHFHQYYHWSIMQAEYAMDIVFKKQKDLKLIYEEITRTMIHTIKPENIATFLGRKLHGNYQDEMGNDFKKRINGTRILHKMGKSWIKMYDKFGLILRIEVTSYNVSDFKHFRKVRHRDGSYSMNIASFKKSIYSLKPLMRIFNACNKRYLEFISCIQDNTTGIKKLNKISKPVKVNNRKYKGLNLFNNDDLIILQSLISGEYNISGFKNKNLREKIPQKSMGQISRILKRLRTHGIIKKIRNTYKYYLTKFGKQVISLGLKLKELYITPSLA
jgi:hypothetical protein